AEAMVEEIDVFNQATGLAPMRYGAGLLSAMRADHASFVAMRTLAVPGAVARGEGAAVGGGYWFASMVHNGRGEYAEAFTEAHRACEREDVMFYGRALGELVEAAVRAGRPEEAADAFERLTARTTPAGTEWALGIEARCRALLSGDEASYREAIERLARS